MYRAVFLSMFQAGLGGGELRYWSAHGLEDLRRQLRENTRFIRIELPGRKHFRNVRPFYTFLARDASEAVRFYMEERPDGQDIFLTAYGTRLTYPTMLDYWYKRLERLGILRRRIGDTSARYGKNMHELRDLFRTRWHRSGADPLVAEFALGHTVDPLGYNKVMEQPSYVLSQYKIAEPWLNIVSDDPERIAAEQLQELDDKYGMAIGLLQKQVQYLVEQLEKKP
jgi:hypothetical protein